MTRRDRETERQREREIFSFTTTPHPTQTLQARMSSQVRFVTAVDRFVLETTGDNFVLFRETSERERERV